MKLFHLSRTFGRFTLLAITLLAGGHTGLAQTIYQWKGGGGLTNWGTVANWATGAGLTAGPGPTNGVYFSRLNVNNAALSELVYTAVEGVTVYSNNSANARGLVIGSGTSGSGTFTLLGGTFSTLGSSGQDAVGNSDNNTGIFNINGGTYISSASGLAVGLGGGANRTSTLNVNSGQALVSSIAINTLRATINLNGGTLAVSNLAVSATLGVNSTNNFNGGTLKARRTTTTFFPVVANAVVQCNVRNGGAVIDTDGFNITIAQPLRHSAIPGDAAIDGGLTKNSAGTLTLSGLNTYTGPTVVNAGGLGVQLPMSSGALTVASGARLTVGATNSAWSLSSASVTNANVDFNYASWTINGYTNAVMYVTNLALSGSVTCNIVGTGFPVTNLTLLTYGAKTGGGSFTLGTLPAGAAATLVDDGANVILQITAASIQNLVWSGGDGIWQTNGAANWNANTATYLEYPSGVNDTVSFNDSPGGTVTISSPVNPSGVTVDVTTGTYTFSGTGSIIGTNGLNKLGTSTLTINNSNAFSGTVTISGGSGTSGGTLFVGHPSALGSTNGGTVVNGPANTLELGVFLGNGVGVTNETVTINGTGVGGARGALRGQQTASGENVWAGPVIIGTSLSRIGTEDSGNLTVAGPITDGGLGYGLLLRPGANGVLTIAGTGSSYAFTRTFGDGGGTGLIKLGANNALSTNRLEFGSGTLDLNGYSQKVGGINNDNNTGPLGTIINNGASPSTFTVHPLTNNFSCPANIQDGASTVSLVKLGTATHTFNGATLTYSGATLVNEGQLILATASIMNSSITVAGGASLGGESTTAGTLTLNANSMLVVDPSTPTSFTASAATATAPVKVSFTSAPPTNSATLVLTATGGITGSAANFQAFGVRGGSFYLTNGNTELMYVAAPGAAIVWKGNDLANPSFWDVVTTTNWSNGGSPDLFYTGDTVTFNDTASSTTVAIQGTSVAPAGVTFNTSSNYTVSGGAIGGAAVVTKSGTGTVTFTAANSYTGVTTINNGTLTVQSSSGLGTTNGGTTVSATGALDLGGAAAANALNLGGELITISGNGFGGNGAVVNNGANTQINAVQKLALAGNASIGGLTRWDMRGSTGGITNALDLAGYTLTKSGSNYIALVDTAIINPGNITIEGGVLGVQVTANLGGSSANTLTVGTNGTLEFFQSTVAPGWTLNLTNGSRFWTESGTGAGTNVWAGPVSLNGAAVLDANGGTMIISGNVTGSGSFLKSGPNTTTLSGDNSYSGGTVITNGFILATTNTAFGTGPVTINAPTTRLTVSDGLTITNAFVLNGGGASSRGLIENSGTGNVTLTGPIAVNGGTSAGGHFASSAGGTLTLAGPITAPAGTNVTCRIGTVIFGGGGSYANLSIFEGTARLATNNGLSTLATVDLAGSAATVLDLAGFNQTLAGITRTSGNSAVISNSSIIADSTLTLTGTSSYPGLIRDSGVALSRVALVVNGGDLTLSGANTYSGGSTVTNGTLRINTTTAAGTGAVTVRNGGTLAGNGTVSGATTTEAGSTLSPGTNGVGTLTFSSGLTIGGNVLVELDKSLAQSNDVANVTGSLSKVGAGTLVVSNLGPALVAGDTFTLFNQPVVNGNLLTISGPAGVTFTNNLALNGSISVGPPGSTIPTTPTNITFSATSSNITIGWPSNYTGWTLQSQTNLRSVGLKTNWFNLAGSELTNSVTLPINKADPTVFFRLIYTNAP